MSEDAEVDGIQHAIRNHLHGLRVGLDLLRPVQPEIGPVMERDLAALAQRVNELLALARSRRDVRSK